MSKKPFLRDLIYFDFDKTASIASQLEDGLLKEIQESYSKTREFGGGIDVQIANIGGNANDSRTKLVTRAIHHDLLVRVEKSLFDAEIATDINEQFVGLSNIEIDKLHQILQHKPYVRVEGTSRFHDYQRMKTYLETINKIVDFMALSVQDSFRKSDAYRLAQAQLAEAKEQAKSLTDRNQKALAKTRIDETEKQLKAGLNQIIEQQSGKIEDWQIEGIKDIVNTVMPKRINLLIQPFEVLKDFRVISNLKQDCFVDSDLDNVLFAYGSQPNVQLTVFGLVTSIPVDKPPQNVVHDTDNQQANENAIKQFERVFHSVFDGTMQIEEFGRFSYYPSVTVYPLAVYYTIRK